MAHSARLGQGNDRCMCLHAFRDVSLSQRQQDVNEVWTGLGYYSRARRLLVWNVCNLEHVSCVSECYSVTILNPVSRNLPKSSQMNSMAFYQRTRTISKRNCLVSAVTPQELWHRLPITIKSPWYNSLYLTHAPAVP